MKIHVLKLKLRKLHKYLGFAFSLFILHLTVTGILLTYPETFNIEETYASNFFILKKYNMDTHREVFGLSNVEDEVVIIKNNIFNFNYCNRNELTRLVELSSHTNFLSY